MHAGIVVLGAVNVGKSFQDFFFREFRWHRRLRAGVGEGSVSGGYLSGGDAVLCPKNRRGSNDAVYVS